MSAAARPGTPATFVDVARLLQSPQVRLVAVFGSLQPERRVRLHYLADVERREYRMLECWADARVPSATAITPSAAWHEREVADQYGVVFENHPDPRPLLFHENWPDDTHPLLSGSGRPPMARREYRFLKVQGTGVCEVPVGPVHAGIIEPGHFRFSVVGDTVLHLELRHFYNHKGTEKLFEGVPVVSAPMLAESVSGDNCFAHAVAYSQAVETALGLAVPPRAGAIRLAGLELERMIAHIADVGAMCGDVGFAVPAAYTARIKESLLQLSARTIGTRFWRGIAIPGGVRRDLSEDAAWALGEGISTAAADFAALARMVLDTPSVQNRFETTGVLRGEAARDLGVVGPAARASGIDFDVRRDHPYGAYAGRAIEVPHYHYGDVLARARVRIDETRISAQLIADCLMSLPGGALSTGVPPDGDGEAFAAVESPRGELGYWVRVRAGRITRCHIKSPSFQNWPALPLAIPGNIIADFPLINKSFNLSYSGCER